MNSLRRAVFLDRDGVVNKAVVRDGKPYPPATAEELELVADAAPALRELKGAGFLLLVVTNQPDIARGTQSVHELDAMHAMLRAELPLDDIFICPHDDVDQCECRKPLPGLLLQAARKYRVDLPLSYLIGDRWRDIEAGQRAGCVTIWIDYGYRERGPSQAPDGRVKSLREAVDWIKIKEEVLQ